MITLNKPQAVKSEEEIVPDISQEVLKRRCLLKDADGNVIETPRQMYMRVAQTIAQVESMYDTQSHIINLLPEIFYKMMADGKFLPNSPTLMNAGRPNGMLSACFVLPVSLEFVLSTVSMRIVNHLRIKYQMLVVTLILNLKMEV